MFYIVVRDATNDGGFYECCSRSENEIIDRALQVHHAHHTDVIVVPVSDGSGFLAGERITPWDCRICGDPIALYQHHDTP